jgi:hypothetical protein
MSMGMNPGLGMGMNPMGYNPQMGMMGGYNPMMMGGMNYNMYSMNNMMAQQQMMQRNAILEAQVHLVLHPTTSFTSSHVLAVLPLYYGKTGLSPPSCSIPTLMTPSRSATSLVI